MRSEWLGAKLRRQAPCRVQPHVGDGYDLRQWTLGKRFGVRLGDRARADDGETDSGVSHALLRRLSAASRMEPAM